MLSSRHCFGASQHSLGIYLLFVAVIVETGWGFENNVDLYLNGEMEYRVGENYIDCCTVKAFAKCEKIIQSWKEPLQTNSK